MLKCTALIDFRLRKHRFFEKKPLTSPDKPLKNNANILLCIFKKIRTVFISESYYMTDFKTCLSNPGFYVIRQISPFLKILHDFSVLRPPVNTV